MRLTIALAAIVLPLIGCQQQQQRIQFPDYEPQPPSAAEAEIWPGPIRATRPNHVIILPGVYGGRHADARHIRKTIEDHFPDTSAQIWDWTLIHPTGRILKDTFDDRLNRGRAAILVDHLNAWWASRGNDEHRVYLVGLSAGTRIGFFTCESAKLAREVAFEDIVLLSGAASSLWNTRPPVARAHQAVFNYCSNADEILPIFSIGLEGYMFVPAGVQQLKWGWKMRDKGNDGKHLNCLDEPFCAECVLPLLTQGVEDWPADCRALGL